MPSFASVEAYLAALPADTLAVVEQVRAAVLAELPGARERISYDILAFVVDDRIVLYVAGWKHHVSVYPIPEGDPAYAAAAAPYVSGRSTLKFPLTSPVPLDLVAWTARLHLGRLQASAPPSA